VGILSVSATRKLAATKENKRGDVISHQALARVLCVRLSRTEREMARSWTHFYFLSVRSVHGKHGFLATHARKKIVMSTTTHERTHSARHENRTTTWAGGRGTTETEEALSRELFSL